MRTARRLGIVFKIRLKHCFSNGKVRCGMNEKQRIEI